MIKEDKIINEWEIYSATQLQKEFNIKEERDKEEPDEEYIIRHLKEDKRMFRVTFMESDRDNAYEEYWFIQEVEQ